VRIVAEVRPEFSTDWPAIKTVPAKPGIGCAETLRKWSRQTEADGGARPRVSSEESAELRKLHAEVRELRRASEILKATSAPFALRRPGEPLPVRRDGEAAASQPERTCELLKNSRSASYAASRDEP
jgi:transposase